MHSTITKEAFWLYAFLVLLPFQDIHLNSYLPVSWCDLTILPISIYLVRKIFSRQLKLDSAMDKWVGIFFLSQLISIVLQSKAEIILQELAIGLYLPIVYYSFASNLSGKGSSRATNFLTYYTITASLVAIATGIGWCYSFYYGIDSVLAKEYVDYPYFGSIFRATALFQTPTMLFSYLQIPLYFSYATFRKNTSDKWNPLWLVLFMLLLAAAILTYSKSILLTIGLLLFYELRSGTRIKRMIKTIILTSLILVSVITSHVLLFGMGKQRNETLSHTSFTSNYVLAETDSFQLVESFYFFSKRCSLTIFQMYPVFGVGTGNFQHEISMLDPYEFTSLEKLKTFDPHSTYFGILTENGCVGLLLTGVIMFMCIRAYKNKLKSCEEPFYLQILGVCMLFFLLDGIVTDFHHFRFFWFCLAVMSSFVQKPQL